MCHIAMKYLKYISTSRKNHFLYNPITINNIYTKNDVVGIIHLILGFTT